MTFGGKILATFRKLYQPEKSQQKQKIFLFIVRGVAVGLFLEPA